jgi:membrane-bound lytic murein transglycosylase B
VNDDFERLVVGSGSDTAPERGRPPTRRRAAVAAIVAAGLIGVAVIAAGLIVGGSAPPRAAEQPTPTAPAPTAVPVDAVDSAAPATSIAALADPNWIDEVAERSGIPVRALAAYTGAALRLEVENPACELGWNTLAAIGHVESEHGTIGGSRLDAQGRATPGIVGIPLDGGEVDAIRDSDGGTLDGDATWDRAVGPMQFIPATWEVFASDGDGDGVADPQQIDDAVLTAASYLCSIGDGPLSEPASWIAAVGAYNSTVDYNNRVAAAAAHYATTG